LFFLRRVFIRNSASSWIKEQNAPYSH
jgi:hypothetical protein